MYFLFDIGGTNLRIAISKDLKKVGPVKKFLTPQEFKDGIGLLVRTAKLLSKDQKILMSAGGFAGPLDKTKSRPLSAPNLPNWKNKPLKAELENGLKCKVLLENDAALAGLGEAHYGAGKKSKVLAYLTISTGVGGARVVEGRIDQCALGFEPGHQIINDQKFLTLQEAVSGRDIFKKYGQDPAKIKNAIFWKKIAQKLAVGLANITVLWSPELIILGGGLILHNKIKISQTLFYLKKLVKIFPRVPPIKKSLLRDKATLWGALYYIKMNL